MFNEVTTLYGHSGTVYSVAFSADNKYLASGGGDNTIIVWKLNTLRKFTSLARLESAVRSVAFSADNRYLAFCSHDNQIKLWSLDNSFKEVTTQQEHSE